MKTPPYGGRDPAGVSSLIRGDDAVEVSQAADRVGMGSDPEPYEPVARFDGKRAVVSPDPGRPEAADLLEVERGMTRVLLQPRVRLGGEVLDR